jgi:hypothetical protein
LPLVFSPLSEEVLDSPPKRLHPRCAFLMRQIGDAPALDLRMVELLAQVFEGRGITILDAGASTGGKDFLERILGLVRGTAFTVAVFSHETRSTAMANIALELGFAAMCGKPLMILKSKEAKAPSDLTRTDWIDYEPADEDAFKAKIALAIDGVEDLAGLEETVLEVALAAPVMDCAVALERVTKAFLITANEDLIARGEEISERIVSAGAVDGVADLDRLRREAATFTRQARQSLRPPRRPA